MKNSLEKTFAKIKNEKKVNVAKIGLHSASRLGAILGLGFGLVVSLNVAIYVQKSHIEAERQSRLETLSEQRAEIAADSVAQYVSSVQEQMRLFAQKGSVVNALIEQNAQNLESAKKSLTSQIKGVEGLALIPVGQASLAPKGSPAIGFTELELIRRMEKRENVLPEATKANNTWYFNFFMPVPFNEKEDVLAVLMVSLDVNIIKESLVKNRLTHGEVSLFQQFKGSEPLTIFSAGEGHLGDAILKPIKDSHWLIGFKPSYVMLENAKTSVMATYLLLAMMSLIVSAFFMYAGLSIGTRFNRRMHVKAKLSSASASPESADDGLALGVRNTDILDVAISEEDEDLLGLDDVVDNTANVVAEQDDILEIEEDANAIPDVIFRAYDIRGIAKEQISTKLAQLVGQSLGSEAIDTGQDTLIVARDARLSSPELTEFLIRGILSSGCNVLNIGTVPTPLMYFATSTLKESQSGVMVTASHNPGEYNGFKIVMNGKTRSDEDIKAIRRRIMKKDLYEGFGEESQHDIVADYIDTIFSDVALAGDISIVIDAGNGVTGIVAPKLFEELGCHVTPLYCDLDGNFPNHSPDPSSEKNLQALIAKVRETGSDLGVAFDGDGDRVIVVTSSGQIIWPDRLLMLFAKDIVSRNPGADVVFDVKSTRHLVNCITSYGGRPIMWKTGHAPMKNKMQETGALLGGEYSGHIFIKDRWFGFDDGMYAAARLIEILSLQGESLDEMFEEFPTSPSTPEIRVPIGDETKFELVAKLAAIGDFGDGRVTKIDGVRVDFPYGWGLVRASNTSPNLTLRFEADDEKALHKVKSILVQELKNVDNTIQIDWN